MRRSILTRFIPDNAIETTFENIKAIVYQYEKEDGTPCAIAYSGRKNSSDFHYKFKTDVQRQQSIQEWKGQLEKRMQEKERQRAAQKAFKHSFEIGSILYESFGYEQTNVTFFEVIEVVTNKTIVIQEICKDIIENHGMSGYAMPLPGSYRGNPIKCRVSVGDVVKIKGRYQAYKWDGLKLYVSWYG